MARKDEASKNEPELSMPVKFDSKTDYYQKLIEFLTIEDEQERLKVESTAIKDISFRFEER